MNKIMKTLSLMFAVGAMLFSSGLHHEDAKVAKAASSSITISYDDTFSPSLPTTENASATSYEDTTSRIKINIASVYKKNTYNYLMFAKDKGYLYNTESLGNISKVSVTYSGSTAAAAKIGVYFSDSIISTRSTTDHKTIAGTSKTDSFSNTTSGNGFFQISTSNKNCQISKIVIDYETSSKSLSDITLSGNYKTSYVEGESFDPTNLVVTASYDDESTADVTSDITISPSGALTTSDTQVTISYNGFGTIITKKIDITVSAKELQSISVKSQPTKTSYYVGQTLDLTGLVLTANYDKGDPVEISSGYTSDNDGYIFTEKDLTNGTKDIKIIYDGKETTITVNIVEKQKQIIDDGKYYIKVEKDKVKYVLDANETNSPSNSDSAPTAVLDSDSVSPWNFEYTERNDVNTFSIYYINANNEKNYLYAIDDNKGLKISNSENEKYWIISSTTDDDGTYYLSTITDNSNRKLALYNTQDWRCYKTETTQSIQKIQLIKYKELESISIVGNLTKVSYHEGDKFDPTGLIVTALYSDNSTETISNDKIEWTPEVLSSGDTSVTATYLGKTATYEGITVASRTLERIEIKQLPTKTIYSYGEYFDSTGLVVNAVYDSGDDVDVTEYISLSYNGCLDTLGQQTITVTYLNKTTTFDITVNIAGGYVRINDASEIKAGDKIIIAAANNDSSYALGTKKSNNMDAAEIKKSYNNTGIDITNTETQVITVETGNKDDTFAFKTNDEYLCAASSSSNNLKTESTLSDNSSWSISIVDGVTTIKAQGEYTRNTIQFNKSAKIFSCYDLSVTSTMEKVAIYKYANNYEYLVNGVSNITCTEMTTYADELVKRYNALSTEDKARFDSSLCEDGVVTLIERLEYISLKSKQDSNQSTSGISLFNNISNKYRTSIILIVGLLGLSAVAAYYFLNKKKYNIQ